MVCYGVHHVDHRSAQRRPHHDWKDTADSATPTAAHTAGAKQSEQRAGRAGGFLGGVERAGNVLPDPFWFFVILIPLGATAFKAVGRPPRCRRDGCLRGVIGWFLFFLAWYGLGLPLGIG